jgi:hypothetical protein
LAACGGELLGPYRLIQPQHTAAAAVAERPKGALSSVRGQPMDWAAQKASGRGARRTKARHGGGGSGRGGGGARGGGGRGGGARGGGSRKGSGGGGGQKPPPRSRRAARGTAGLQSNEWRFQEEAEEAAEYEERLALEGEDIDELLLHSQGTSYGVSYPARPVVGGTPDCVRLAALVGALGAPERLQLEPDLFEEEKVAGRGEHPLPAGGYERAASELAAEAEREARLDQLGRGGGGGGGDGRATNLHHDPAVGGGGPMGRGRGRGAGAMAVAAPAGGGAGRGRGRGRGVPGPPLAPVAVVQGAAAAGRGRGRGGATAIAQGRRLCTAAARLIEERSRAYHP